MIRRGFLRGCALALCVVALLFPVAASAAAVVDADIGYEGAITFVRTLPVNVRITNSGADASGCIAVDVNRSQSDYDRYEWPLSIAAGSTLEVRLPVVLTQRQDRYTVSWIVDGETVAQREISPESVIDPSSLIVGLLGGDAGQSISLVVSKAADPLSRGESWAVVALDAESFPADVESLRFFDILAVDGFDMSVLSQEQKGALDAWIREGGVAIVGGGARAAENFPFFSQYTGIAAGAIENGGDITVELMDELGFTGSPLGREVMTVALDGASGKTLGEPALVDVTAAEQGYVITSAFALTEKPLNEWLGNNVLWQRVLISCAQLRYREMVQARQSGGYVQENRSYVDTGITNRIGVENTGAVALPMVVIGAFVLLAGFGGYWLLKRLDRREWMWALVPALAAAASLAMWGMSVSLPLREPIATYYTMIDVDSNGAQDGYTAVMAAKAGREDMTVGAANGRVDLTGSISYYYSNDPNEQERAANLRYRCTYGPVTTITFPQNGSWNYATFIVRDIPQEDLSGVSGTCRWEGESLVCTVTNQSRIALDGGVVFTDRGFATTGDLLPGQTATVTLSPLPGDTPGADLSWEEIVSDGTLLSERNGMNYSYYDFQERYVALNEKEPGSQAYNDAFIRRAMLNNISYNSNEEMFRFVAFSGEIAEPALEIDGQAVERMAGYGMVSVDLTYDPVSPDGSVRFLRGSFPVYAAAVDGSGRPGLGTQLDSNQYQSFPLLIDQFFAFDLSALPEGFAMTDMDISSRYSYYSYRISLYNTQTRQWDEFKRFTLDKTTGMGTEEIFPPELAKYMLDGVLYCRFEKQDNEADYADMGTPMLTMEGRME